MAQHHPEPTHTAADGQTSSSASNPPTVTASTKTTDAVVSRSEFDERWYLWKYPDVKRAVDQGAFKGAYEHYCIAGVREQRAWHRYVSNPAELLTLEHAPFRYLFYRAAHHHQVEPMQRGEPLAGYLARTFKKQGMIHE